MELEISYRDAEVADCESLGNMISLASGGVVNFLFHSLVPQVTPEQIIAKNMTRLGPAHSYQNTQVALCQQRVVGMVLSFPAEHHVISDEAHGFFPAERLTRLDDFFAARIDGSMLVDALYVAEDSRRRGIASHLIQQVKDKALTSGFKMLSLIVFADNHSARALYEKQGFEVLRHVTLDPDALIPHHGGCLLMKCEI